MSFRQVALLRFAWIMIALACSAAAALGGDTGAPTPGSQTPAQPVPRPDQQPPPPSGSAPASAMPKETVSCADMADAMLRADDAARIELARSAITRPCRPAPAPLWNAIRYGKWDDSKVLAGPDRAGLLGLMAHQKYAEAETLSVQLLEKGPWPDGMPVTQGQAEPLIRGLKPVLTPYRIHLLLDVYEQRTDPVIRLAVLQTLHGSDPSRLPEVMLPAVNACWEDSGRVKAEAMSMIQERPEKTCDAVLASLIKKLPSGPLLDWAERLGNAHPSRDVTAALKKRGAKKA